ncbi:hypothetical protein [Methylobacterium trifolii]|uniref:Lipoprotein n=1 Tax=Methylobacterium trifolii TaxID=1003092 RepID=A0ABQ4TX69_9HYPH|nr:hypothetical protein [Methylobacterium trifolii]GJE58583.1 hypothetical protein MPOCJGCO_0665 [Methylobacterium trifolii]
MPLPHPHHAALLAVSLAVSGCTTASPAPEAAAPATLREKIAALALAQVAFGSVSLLPVRFESSRIAGPFEDGGRTLYCVSSQMKGRSFGKAERPKVVVREDKAAGRISVIDDDEVCSGHRSEPFSELDRLGNGR